MPEKITVEFNGKEQRITVVGEVGSDDLRTLAYIDHEDERSLNVRRTITDLTQAIPIGIKNSDIDVIVAIDIGAYLTNSIEKVALIATNEQILKYCSYYIETLEKLGAQWEVKTFPNEEEARAWFNE